MDSFDNISISEFDLSYESDEEVFEILTTNEVVKYMDDVIANIRSVLQIPSASVVRVLLNHFKWDEEVMMDRLYGDDQEQLFEELKMANPFTTPACEARATTEQDECRVCYAVLSGSKLIELECGHRFCCDCWNSNLNEKILEQGIDTITCLEYECNVLLEQEDCLDILQDLRMRQIYKRLITNTFVESNFGLTWCPNPNCDKAVKVESGVMQPVTCSCNVTFCFACGEDWHNLLRCDLRKAWMKRCLNDLATANWLLANSKDCPKCKTPIEKNGGCNQMKCGNESCRFSFCWICMAASDGIICGCGLDENRVSERFKFYHDRYLHHRRSLQLEEKLIANVEVKVRELLDSGVPAADSEVLEKSVFVLRRCRKTVMYTYPFAFYLHQECNQAEIFKNYQADLQIATENLSGCLEREMDGDCFATFKEKLLELYKDCEYHCGVLEQHVEDENIQWRFSADEEI